MHPFWKTVFEPLFPYHPRFLQHKKKFIKMGGNVTHLYPILSDHKYEAGLAYGHYFHQDLLVASYIYQRNPKRHIDIASRIDGFVAHVATFREIEILDIRKLQDTGHDNIKFIQADLMSKNNLGLSDSISCLHAIEHFGLGRYGDPIDPNGHKKAFKNLLETLSPLGYLYIGVPIGKDNEVHFNAHRVFHPLDILTWGEPDTYDLTQFDFVDDEGKIHKNINIHNTKINVNYGCGIYTLKKK